MKRVYPVEDYCIACHLCEVACVVEHSRSKNIFHAYNETPKVNSKIEVQMHGAISFSGNCRHCVNCECVEACPVSAITKDDATGIVKVDEKRCIGCWMCIMACPQGSITPRVDEKAKLRVSDKCDMCEGRDLGPACVQACPNDALVYEDRDADAADGTVMKGSIRHYAEGGDMNVED